ncbi:hypothetical protein V3W47_03955 [Deinococcus sp. YIM 134068]
MIGLTLLALIWLVPRLAASSMVPADLEYRAWPPLKDDLHALKLTAEDVRVDVHGMSFDKNDMPLDARYVLRGMDAARLNIPAVWQTRGVPERPARVWFWGRSRPGKADDCPQELALVMSRGRRVENAVLTWREQTPQGQRQATLTVWRAAGRSVWPLSRANGLVCVESSRTRTTP